MFKRTLFIVLPLVSTLFTACEPVPVCNPGEGGRYCQQTDLVEQTACLTGSEDVYAEIMQGQNCFLPAYDTVEEQCREGCLFHYVDEETVSTADPATAGADAEGSVRLQSVCETACQARLKFEIDHASPSARNPDAGVPAPAPTSTY